MIDIGKIVKKQNEYFNNGQTRSIKFRKKQLKKLKQVIIKNEDKILTALKKDLYKPEFESYMTEISFVLKEIKNTLKNLSNWAKPDKVKTPLHLLFSRSYVYKDPYGVVLIISPWNYPFQLLLAPLIGSIAAGNCTILKPSEYSKHTSKLISEIINENFENDYIAVIEGGKEISQRLLQEKFDYIFFTGSIKVGKIVMKKAAENLTPVTLELGGKSPCIVESDADLKLAAKRITWGKFINAGQTCVAPDYLLVQQDIKQELIDKITGKITEFFGDSPRQTSDYPRIINKRHVDRLSNLLDKGKIIVGGEINKDEKYIAPTVIDDISWEDPIMQEEIFGPLLPVLTYDYIDEAINKVREKPKPLALYLFINNKKIEDKVMNSVSFGGGCINDTVIHLSSSYLPFGGVGNSGMGSYHGKTSFDTFSHQKSVLKKSNLIDFKFRFPPYKNKTELLKKILKLIGIR